MATTDKKQATRTTIDELNEKLSSAEQSVEKNKKNPLRRNRCRGCSGYRLLGILRLLPE